MNPDQENRLRKMLKEALPPMGEREPARDFQPAMERRLQSKGPAPPWFDWALAGAMVLFVVSCPGAIPVLLYYL